MIFSQNDVHQVMLRLVYLWEYRMIFLRGIQNDLCHVIYRIVYLQVHRMVLFRGIQNDLHQVVLRLIFLTGTENDFCLGARCSLSISC